MSDSDSKSAKGGGGCFFKSLVVLVLALLIGWFGFIWLSNQGLNLTKEAVQVFRPKMIVKSFAEWRELLVEGNEGNILEVATATATEDFSREATVTIMSRPIVSKTSSISVPATYRFHIDLTGNWQVVEDGSRIIITAPELRPSLPVAFDTARMEKRTEEGWGRYIPTSTMAELEKNLTEKLGERAAAPETFAKVREKARRSIAKFLQSWLLTEEQWREGQFEELVVLFEGEDPDMLTPVLKVGVPDVIVPDDMEGEVPTPKIVKKEDVTLAPDKSAIATVPEVEAARAAAAEEELPEALADGEKKRAEEKGKAPAGGKGDAPKAKAAEAKGAKGAKAVGPESEPDRSEKGQGGTEREKKPTGSAPPSAESETAPETPGAGDGET